MARFVGLDVSQKLTSICVVDDAGRRLWRGQCHSEPEPPSSKESITASAALFVSVWAMPLMQRLRPRGGILNSQVRGKRGTVAGHVPDVQIVDRGDARKARQRSADVIV